MRIRTMLEAVEEILERGHAVGNALVVVQHGSFLYPVYDVHGELVSEEDDDAKLMVSIGKDVNPNWESTGYGDITARYLCERFEFLMGAGYSNISLQFKHDLKGSVTAIEDAWFSGKKGVLVIDLDME